MSSTEIAVFGGGCFWCTEAVFQMLRGVTAVTSGYAGGQSEHPTYESVSLGSTGHAEVIHITYDPALINYEDLLTVFFASHDPTTRNRQGADIGTQYRSIILYTSEDQKATAERYIAELKTQGVNAVTEIQPLGKFFEAEEYHRNYYRENPEQGYCKAVIDPKLKKVKEKFAKLLDERMK